jgi:integrase
MANSPLSPINIEHGFTNAKLLIRIRHQNAGILYLGFSFLLSCLNPLFCLGLPGRTLDNGVSWLSMVSFGNIRRFWDCGVLQMLHNGRPPHYQAPRSMPPIRFGTFRREVLELYQAPLRASATRTKMVQVLDELADLGVRSTRDLTPATIARFVAAAPERSPWTVNELLGYLRKLCRYASKRGYLDHSPFDAHSFWLRTDRTVEDDEESPAIAIPTRDQVERVLAHLAAGAEAWSVHRLLAATAHVAGSGLRRGEALHCRVADVDLVVGLTRVRSRRRYRGKTSASIAPVAMAPWSVKVLAGWIPRLAGSKWLYPNLRGSGPWIHGGAGYRPVDQLRAAGQAVGVEGLTFQSLRHWVASEMEARGVPELLIQRQLRHTRPTTTAGYRHADLDAMRAAAATLKLAPRPASPPTGLHPIIQTRDDV